MKAELIVFFRLFLVRVELNEWNHFVLQKPPHLLSAFKFYAQRELAVTMIIQLSKNIWFIGVCVETESARMIRAQAPRWVGWYLKTNRDTCSESSRPYVLPKHSEDWEREGFGVLIGARDCLCACDWPMLWLWFWFNDFNCKLLYVLGNWFARAQETMKLGTFPFN